MPNTRLPEKLLFSILLLGLLCLSFAAAPSLAAPQFVKPTIVEARSYPWSALGRVNTGGRGYCTGVLISERHVLSPAGCLYNAVEGRWWSAAELHFVAGYQRERYRYHAPVAHYRVAPDFAGGEAATLANLLNDWALITLRSSVGRDAGWMPVQWLDEATLRRYKRGEVRVLDAGYRRDRPHVVTVAPGCGLDGAGMRCPVAPADSGLLNLLLVDGELKVLGSASMNRDAALKSALKPVSLTARQAPAPAPLPASLPGVQPVKTALPGGYVVQLASYTSPETAERGQAALQQRHAALLAEFALAVVVGKHQELGTVYRLRSGPFATAAEARGLCDSLRQRDQDCLVAKAE